jgi:hypothetical protein
MRFRRALSPPREAEEGVVVVQVPSRRAASTAHRQPSPACLLARETTQAVEHERRCAGIEVPALRALEEARREGSVRE